MGRGLPARAPLPAPPRPPAHAGPGRPPAPGPRRPGLQGVPPPPSGPCPCRLRAPCARRPRHRRYGPSPPAGRAGIADRAAASPARVRAREPGGPRVGRRASRVAGRRGLRRCSPCARRAGGRCRPAPAGLPAFRLEACGLERCKLSARLTVCHRPPHPPQRIVPSGGGWGGGSSREYSRVVARPDPGRIGSDRTDPYHRCFPRVRAWPMRPPAPAILG